MPNKIKQLFKCIIVVIFTITTIWLIYEKYNYQKFVNMHYKYEYQNNLRTLNFFDINLSHSVELMALVSVSSDIINIGNQEKLDMNIDFSYLCETWDEDKIQNMLKRSHLRIQN